MSEAEAALRLRFEDRRQYRALRSALVFDGYLKGSEEAAFLFASRPENGELTVVDVKVLRPSDFSIQAARYLDLQENVLQEMLVHAHKTDTALVEAHSHPFTVGRGVGFSALDCGELAEIGPHVAWRLPGRPYVALVFGWSAFDSLYWEGSDESPRGSVDLLVCGQLLRASRESERRWRRCYG